jgi:hypothetical protein
MVTRDDSVTLGGEEQSKSKERESTPSLAHQSTILRKKGPPFGSQGIRFFSYLKIRGTHRV